LEVRGTPAGGGAVAQICQAVGLGTAPGYLGEMC